MPFSDRSSKYIKTGDTWRQHALKCIGNSSSRSLPDFKMKLSVLPLIFAISASAAPAGCDFGLEGFAKDNPLGPTTGGASGKTVTVTTVPEFLEAIKGSEPKIIKAKGNFNFTSRPKVGSNKSLIGFGKGAQITGAGLTIVNSSNVIVRNFAIRDILDNDGITIQNSTRVWIDHNEFSSSNFPAAVSLNSRRARETTAYFVSTS